MQYQNKQWIFGARFDIINADETCRIVPNGFTS